MVKPNAKNFIVSLIIWILIIVPLFYLVVFESTRGFREGIVPIFGLPLFLHNIMLFIWIYILGMLAVIIFPRILTPVFLKIKNIVWRNYKDAYVEIQEDIFSFKKFLKRGVFVFLFVLGLSATLIFYEIIDPLMFISKDLAEDLENQNIKLLYSMDVYFGIICILFPFVLGIWSIGWALEDAGLIHFHLPNAKEPKLFDIEPIHLRFTNLIKGYAGLSAIIYYISAITYYITHHPERIENILLLLIFGLISIILIIPPYLLYWKSNKKFLRKGLKELKRITEMEFNN